MSKTIAPCEITRLQSDILTGGVEMVLSIPKDQAYAARLIAEDFKGKRLTFTVAEYRKKRSLDANALCWKLCTEIAKVSGVTKEDVYRENIRQVGEFIPLPIREDAVGKFQEAWSQKGIGWFVDIVDDSKLENYKKVFAYYGSSTYSVADMSRLLDNIIQDAKAVGVKVLSQRELSLIMEDWNGGTKK